MSAVMAFLDDIPTAAAIAGLALGLVCIKAWEWRARRRA